MEKKKFQCWVEDDTLKALDEALKGGTRVDWLHQMINITVNGMPLLKETECSELNASMVGLPIKEDKYKLLEGAIEKLGFESVEDFIESTIDEAVLKSKALPEREYHKEKELFNKIKKARKAKNLTQDEIGTLIGISKSYYNLIENGSRLPSIDIVSKIAKLIGLSLEEFYKAHRELEKR